jgi:intron-binding protein aquarius
VALSRARLGLYILGRREVFETCYELKPAFELLLQRPDKLTLATGELWPSERVQSNEDGDVVKGEAVMEGVEHLGQYVFEMTTSKVKQLRAAKGLPESETVDILEPVNEEDESAYVEGVPNTENGEAEGSDVEKE